MIELEKGIEIIRLARVEHWPPGTIARQLSVHGDVVKRILEQEGMPRPAGKPRASIIDPYLPFIQETLQRYPTLPASRLYSMVVERGYPGQPDHFRHQISKLRPRKPAEAYLRLRTLPGEQAQVDWGHFGKHRVGMAERSLMAFVVVLSWSRMIFLRFFYDQKMANFLQGHVEAFEAFGGCARVCLYDNLKSAVLERQGGAIRFNPKLLEFASHYRYEPRPVAPYRGNEKGRVERAIRYVRDSFFPARTFKDLDDLNQQALNWCQGQASRRPCPQNQAMTVREAFEHEKPKLLPLPDNPFHVEDCQECKVGKTPYVRYDRNDYSVPYDRVRRILTVRATEKQVRVFDGLEMIATHARTYDKGQQVENPDHTAELKHRKRQARHHRGFDRLFDASLLCEELMQRLAERGENLGAATSMLLRMLEQYGATDLHGAVQEALENSTPHPNSVRYILEREAKAANQAPKVEVPLPDNPKVKNLSVQPHALSQYDLTQEDLNDEP